MTHKASTPACTSLIPSSYLLFTRTARHKLLKMDKFLFLNHPPSHDSKQIKIRKKRADMKQKDSETVADSPPAGTAPQRAVTVRVYHPLVGRWTGSIRLPTALDKDHIFFRHSTKKKQITWNLWQNDPKCPWNIFHKCQKKLFFYPGMHRTQKYTETSRFTHTTVVT